jgi:PAS domain S-box
MANKEILLVEDEALIALAEAEAIKRWGYDIICAYSGEEALQKALGDLDLRLILMDINLGRGMDGTEAAQRILAIREIPIVFLTSHSEQEMVQKVRGITRYGYVIKNSGDFVLQSSIEMALLLFDSIQAMKSNEAALLQEQYLLGTLMDNVHDYVYFKDRQSRFLRASKALASSFGIEDPRSLIGKTDFDLFTEEHARQAYDDEQRIIQTGIPIRIEEKETRAGRPDAWVSTEKLPLRNKEGKIIGTFGISRDITERRQAEEKLEFQERLFATLSGINRVITRVAESSTLFEEVCKIAVNVGKFRMAWIGMQDGEDERLLRTPFSCFAGEDKTSEIDTICSIPWNNNPLALAIKNGKVILYEDPADMSLNKNSSIDFRSSAAIPFRQGDAMRGALSIYATETGFFAVEEKELLGEIGIDISFALERMGLGKP